MQPGIGNRNPNRVQAERDEHPVLYVEVPPKTTRKALAERILSALGATVPANTTEVRSTERAIAHLDRQGVKVLILDEAQHLVIPEKRQLNYEAADWVKCVANAGVCAVVLAGVSDAWEAYLYNGQLRRRSFANRRLGRFRVSEATDWKIFRGLLHRYSELLPFPGTSDLKDELTALRVHRQCEGLMGRLSDFIMTETIVGLENNRDRLDQTILHATAKQLRDLGDPHWVNPFDMDHSALLEAASAAEADTIPHAGLAQLTGLRRGRRTPRLRDALG